MKDFAVPVWELNTERGRDRAIASGCRAAILDTLSFQAPLFTRNAATFASGWSMTIEWVQRIFMQKRLHT